MGGRWGSRHPQTVLVESLAMSADSASPPFIAGLRCLRCGRTFPADYPGFLCPDHANTGSDLGTLDVLYDLDAVRAATSPAAIAADPDPSMGRYWALLPVRDRASLPPLPVGGTPLLHAQRLGASIGLARL